MPPDSGAVGGRGQSYAEGPGFRSCVKVFSNVHLWDGPDGGDQRCDHPREDHDTYEDYLYACRDGVTFRKRNLDAVRQKDEEAEEDKKRNAATKRVRQNTFDAFPEVPEVTAWLCGFREEVDRYPFLVVLGPSRSRKTEYAKSLFKAKLVEDTGCPNGMLGLGVLGL